MRRRGARDTAVIRHTYTHMCCQAQASQYFFFKGNIKPPADTNPLRGKTCLSGEFERKKIPYDRLLFVIALPDFIKIFACDSIIAN
jgi:hypothetical protein